MKHEFLKYIPVVGEKHVGIAVIRTTFNDSQQSKIITRHKVLPNDQGGYWVNGASLKTGVANGKDTYAPSFQFDSAYENDEMRALILESAIAHMPDAGASVFASPSSKADSSKNLWNSPLPPQGEPAPIEPEFPF